MAYLIKEKRMGKVISSEPLYKEDIPAYQAIECSHCNQKMILPYQRYEYEMLICSKCGANNTDNLYHDYCCKCGIKFE